MLLGISFIVGLGIEIYDDEIPKIARALDYVFIASRLINVFIRVSEPLIWHELKKSFCKSTLKKQIYSDEALSSFLNSAINVEFVYLILNGVKQSIDQEIDR